MQKKIVEEFAALDAKILSAQEMITGLDADIKAKFNELFVNKNFPQKEWSEVLTIQNGRDYKAVQNPEGKYPVYGSGGIMDYANEYICPENSVVIGRKGTINKPLFVKEKFWNIDTAFGLIADEKILSATYLFYFCLAFDFEKLNKQLTLPSLTIKDLQKILMPLPPLELQKKFAADVENCEALKSSARANREKLILEREELVTKYFR